MATSVCNAFSRTLAFLHGGYIVSFFLHQAIHFCRSRTLSVLRKGITNGQLWIIDQELGTIPLGSSRGGKRSATLIVKDSIFWVRIFTSYDIGFSESWMASEIETDDLRQLLNLYIDNLERLDGLSSAFYKLYWVYYMVFTHFFRFTLRQSVFNADGYNLSNDFYRAMLSTEMKYSCPLWASEEGGTNGDLEGLGHPQDLEAAQSRMIHYVLSQATIKPGDRILEIGSGWGGLAIAAGKLGCFVDTITVSKQQYIGAKEQIKAAGVEDRVTVHLLDYRSLPADFEGAFDACVSLEMLEAVGRRNMPKYVSTIAWALKNRDCRVVLTATTYPESRYHAWQGNDFTRKHHWPHCFAPSLSSLVEDFRKSFDLVKAEDLSLHYPRCLREWGRRLEKNWDQCGLTEKLVRQYPELNDPAKIEFLKRRWEYMFTYMAVSYGRGGLGLGCWTFTKPRLYFGDEDGWHYTMDRKEFSNYNPL